MSKDRKIGSSWRYLLLFLGSTVLVLASLAGDWLEPAPRAWSLTLGFGLLLVGLLGTGRRLVLPLLVALVLLVFCGVSALVATPQPAAEIVENARGLTQDQVKASTPAEGFQTEPSVGGFHDAALITGLGGLALFWSVLLLTLYSRPVVERRERSPDLLMRVGRSLVLIGFIGVGAALARFIATQIPSDDLFESLKSFWIGGTVFLLIATFAVPGFALWLQGLIGSHASKRSYWQLGILAALWVGLLIPTGQRGFLIALGLMLLAVLLGNRMIKTSTAVIVVLVGVLFIGLTQGFRNQAREEGRVTLGGFVERVSPNEWRDLYGSQIASFNWTVIISQNREQLDIPNSYVGLLEKPIPRSLLPEKSQGMGAEFTEKVYPDAFEQDVSFAIPFFAEAEFNLGLIGMILASALLGAIVWGADRFFARRAPPLVEPVVLATVFWFLFEMVRGDTANALAFSAAWIVPLLVFSRAIGLRDRRAPRRLVVDATQVPPRFSGIGRRMIEIGESLRREPLDLPVEVVCARDVQGMLAKAFPGETRFSTPISSSRPRMLRILYQQLVLPFRYRARTVLLSPGDQAPGWGSSPLVFVIHDTRRLDLPESAGSRWEAGFYGFVMAVGARRATAIITISNFTESRIRKLFDPSCPVEIVAPGPGAVEPVDESSLRDAPPSFLALGAIRRYKGTETVARAFLELASGNGKFEPGVHFVGEIEEGLPPAVQEELEGESNGRIRFEGWLDDGEVNDLAHGIAGAIHASEYEGYGLPVAETLALGLPTIASDIPPHREIGGDAVRYFTPGDSLALADLIVEIAGNTDLRVEMALAARERSEEIRRSVSSWSDVLRPAVTAAAQP